VAFDEELGGRIRELLAGERGVSEKRMFGGLAFLVRGNMAIAASGQGGALVRCDPHETDALVARTNAETMVMRGREMQGWLRVAAEHLGTKRQLANWVAIGAAYAKRLPPK
jgi:TfoX/Sxy family transcriptional regulator of competence genes